MRIAWTRYRLYPDIGPGVVELTTAIGNTSPHLNKKFEVPAAERVEATLRVQLLHALSSNNEARSAVLQNYTNRLISQKFATNEIVQLTNMGSSKFKDILDKIYMPLAQCPRAISLRFDLLHACMNTQLANLLRTTDHNPDTAFVSWEIDESRDTPSSNHLEDLAGYSSFTKCTSTISSYETCS